MKLYMVTWNDNVTQFVVDAKNEDDAITKAIEAHKDYDSRFGPYEDRNEGDIQLEDIVDRDSYEVEDIDGIEYLYNVIRRNDWLGVYGDAIVFEY